MAQLDQSGDWKDRLAPSLDEITSLAIEAYASLPESFRALTGEIRFHVADFPDDAVMEEMALEDNFEILGLFEGAPIGLSAGAGGFTGQLPNRILLYRRPILDHWAETEDSLGDIVTHVLVHEIGHHFGLSDADMEALEASAD
ncbi:metallopeptidase family protein [Mangrovibrevibacter kandeliae]|uniref:metallopeptidase family protein n=1 Tax=Mangrovibrevibacter kandeliae TaxID=2968473 RepID=UPI002117866C|nr:metallopeptidase family protein [Aurantimonas sp. CSK15Z-1]MCQ8783584.1 metallopeptidase family protein [Aurantimonas sp. CSK15Z-1]